MLRNLYGLRQENRRTFRLRFYEPLPDLSQQGDELVDVGETRFGDDLAQNEDSFKGRLTRAYYLPTAVVQTSV